MSSLWTKLIFLILAYKLITCELKSVKVFTKRLETVKQFPIPPLPLKPALRSWWFFFDPYFYYLLVTAHDLMGIDPYPSDDTSGLKWSIR